MAKDITGFGAVVSLFASKTYPSGIVITQFADDADAVDMSSIRIADVAMGLNGDLISWSRSIALPLTISVIPASEDDINLGTLANINRVGKNKISAYDEITLTVVYPDGRKIIFSKGKLTDAMFGQSIASAGRLKSRTYAFAFENVIGV